EGALRRRRHLRPDLHAIVSHLASTPALRRAGFGLRITLKQPSVLPGFNLTLGYTLLYLGLLVLIPLAGLVLKAARVPPAQFWAIATAPRTLAAFKLSFGASLVAAATNVVFGLLLAWVLVRYRFPGRTFVNSLVDLPFALPTAVAGITL